MWVDMRFEKAAKYRFHIKISCILNRKSTMKLSYRHFLTVTYAVRANGIYFRKKNVFATF